MLEDILKKYGVVEVSAMDVYSDIFHLGENRIQTHNESKGATLKVLDKDIDTSTTTGRFFLTMIGAMAELERENINQRVREGIAIAKGQGKYKGRKKGSIELNGK